MSSGRRNILLRAAVSLALVVLVLRKVEWPALGAMLARLQPNWAIAGSLMTFLLLVGLAIRWRIFLREQGIALPGRTIFGLIWTGQFFNSVLPGSTGGDFVKIYQVCRLEPMRKAAAAATVVADRVAALLALLVWAVVAFVLEPAPLRVLFRQGVTVSQAILALVVFAMIGTALGGWAFRRFRATVWIERLLRMLAAVKGCLSLKTSLVFAVLLAFGVHAVNFTIIYLFARALYIEISYAEILLMMPVVLFLLMVPVTINGHGLRELLFIGYFTHFEVGLATTSTAGLQEIVVALSILLVANDLAWSLPGGILYFLQSRGGPRASGTRL